ncbi:hypothetical protein FGADI_11889 [Fusarium gaditjirri]|uniref:Uncharacterized protein n=1 Tax=Fusarium gaditjirri TaxID=282569 RepID=A0A8H4WPR3_9HYPO|nr:hypothetical protein FGADI_11889 [Fusarium gaditjirri]
MPSIISQTLLFPPYPPMAPAKSPRPVDALIINIPKELEPKGPSGTVIIPKSQPKNKKAAASGEANPKA